MDFKVEKIEKYGREVWSHVEMDELRRSQCLCLNCALIRKCAIAQAGYRLCEKNGVAFAMTRCPKYEHDGRRAQETK